MHAEFHHVCELRSWNVNGRRGLECVWRGIRKKTKGGWRWKWRSSVTVISVPLPVPNIITNPHQPDIQQTTTILPFHQFQLIISSSCFSLLVPPHHTYTHTKPNPFFHSNNPFCILFFLFLYYPVLYWKKKKKKTGFCDWGLRRSHGVFCF